jgi:hypothetical protein
MKDEAYDCADFGVKIGPAYEGVEGKEDRPEWYMCLHEHELHIGMVCMEFPSERNARDAMRLVMQVGALTTEGNHDPEKN